MNSKFVCVTTKYYLTKLKKRICEVCILTLNRDDFLACDSVSVHRSLIKPDDFQKKRFCEECRLINLIKVNENKYNDCIPCAIHNIKFNDYITSTSNDTDQIETNIEDSLNSTINTCINSIYCICRLCEAAMFTPFEVPFIQPISLEETSENSNNLLILEEEDDVILIENEIETVYVSDDDDENFKMEN